MKAQRVVLLAVTSGLLAGLAWTGTAAAQGACENLWYQRNSIYAARGYCFRTARAQAVFGPGCYPPYGRLSPGEQSQVAGIQRQEGQLGCPP